MKSGIYCIKNKINNNQYVGSAVNLKRRFYAHINGLKNDSHYNKRLQNAWNKYGNENFEFIVLEYVEKEKLIEREQYYLNLLKINNNGYNLYFTAGSSLGTKQSQETIIKRIMKIKGLKRSDEQKKNISLSLKGKKWNENHKMAFLRCRIEKNIKTSIVLKGHIVSEKTKEKLRNFNLGKKHTDETKRKISQKLKGRKMSEEQKLLISNVHKGRKFSKEHIRKLSESHRGYKQTKEQILKRVSKLKGKKRTKEQCLAISLRLIGKKLSPEHRKKISESHKGYIPTKQQREKISKSNKGKKRTVETCNKISIAKLKYYENLKNNNLLKQAI